MTTREEANTALLKLVEFYRGYCRERGGQKSDDSAELVAGFSIALPDGRTVAVSRLTRNPPRNPWTPA